MSPIETYLLDLRTALGDRLSPSVTEARLREAKAHLLASAEDVGETEAIRRFGRPHRVANELVRAHRGYDEGSVWRLALLPVSVLLVDGVFVPILVVPGFAGSWVPLIIGLGRLLELLAAIVFLARVIQTRRWLAGPMIAVHGVTLTFLMLLNLLHGSRWSRSLTQFLVYDLVATLAAWLALNALALLLGRLLDLQRIRPTRSAR